MELTRLITGAFRESYLVGGALRDALLKRPFKDIDLAVPPAPDFRARTLRLARKLGSACFPLDEENQVYRLIMRKAPGCQLDITPFVGGTLESDLRRRDFTVNALALKLSPALVLKQDRKTGAFTFKPDRSKIIDLGGGLKDLSQKKIRQLRPGVFKDDPVRLLRAFRIASELGFTITPQTLKDVKSQAGLIKKPAQERVREELMRLFKSPESHEWLALMHSAGLLCAIFPDLAAQETCAVDYYGKGGVLKHTLRVVERLDYFFENLPAYFPGHKKVAEFLERRETLKLAALLHDIAKPPKAAMIKGRLRFFGHEEYGAILAERVMEDLRCPKTDIKLVTKIIGTHLRPGNLAANDHISDRAMFRFFRTMGEYTVPLLALSWADHSSYVSAEKLKSMRRRLQEDPAPLPPGGVPYNSPKKTLRFMQVLGLLLRVYIKKNMKSRSARLVDGNDVIRTLKLPEGPRIGEILEKVHLLQFEGKIKTREQALKAMKGMGGAG